MIFTLYHHSKKDSASRPSSSGSPRLLTESPHGIVGETSGETTPLQHVGPVEEAAPACSSMRPRKTGARRSPCSRCDLSLWWHSNVPEAGRVSHEQCTRKAPKCSVPWNLLYFLTEKQNAVLLQQVQTSRERLDYSNLLNLFAEKLLAIRCTYLAADTHQAHTVATCSNHV